MRAYVQRLRRKLVVHHQYARLLPAPLRRRAPLGRRRFRIIRRGERDTKEGADSWPDNRRLRLRLPPNREVRKASNGR